MPQDLLYLPASLLCLMASLAVLAVAWPQWRMAVLAGLVGLPFLPFAALFNGLYWVTPRLGGFAWGLEDAIYMFAMGMRAWSFASLAGGVTRAALPRPCLDLRRLAAVTAAALLTFGLCVAIGLPAEIGAFAVPGGLALLALLRRPALRGPALAGAFGCLLLGWAELRVWYWIWPEFHTHWVADAWSGRMVTGAPLGDLLWSMLFGAAHPVVLLLALRCAR